MKWTSNPQQAILCVFMPCRQNLRNLDLLILLFEGFFLCSPTVLTTDLFGLQTWAGLKKPSGYAFFSGQTELPLHSNKTYGWDRMATLSRSRKRGNCYRIVGLWIRASMWNSSLMKIKQIEEEGKKMKWKFEETCGFISQWYPAEAGLLSGKQTVDDNKNMIFIHTPYFNSRWAHFTAWKLQRRSDVMCSLWCLAKWGC